MTDREVIISRLLAVIPNQGASEVVAALCHEAGKAWAAEGEVKPSNGSMIRQPVLLSNEQPQAEPSGAMRPSAVRQALLDSPVLAEWATRYPDSDAEPSGWEQAIYARVAVERVILRRLHERRIDGFTLEMAQEIVAALASPLPLPEPGEGETCAQSQPCAEAGAHIPLSPQPHSHLKKED